MYNASSMKYACQLVREVPDIASVVVGGRLDQRSINRRCHGTIAFGH